MKGKIIRAISGFYYVQAGRDLWTCKAKGVFRNLGLKPMVGDDVEIEALFPERLEGNLIRVLTRRNVLIRPAAANIDQALIVFAVREPDPSFNLLDRFLICMGMQKIPTVIYLNKMDLDKNGEGGKYREIYETAGYRVITGSSGSEMTQTEIRRELRGKTTVLAGPSGVGKSSLTNYLFREAGMEVGELSEKIKRGKQTTRHTELFTIEENTYILDTPGFTSLYVQGVPSGELRTYFDEFEEAGRNCRFLSCSHVNEPFGLCGVKQAVQEGRISPMRYENYCQIYKEVKENEHKY